MSICVILDDKYYQKIFEVGPPSVHISHRNTQTNWVPEKSIRSIFDHVYSKISVIFLLFWISKKDKKKEEEEEKKKLSTVNNILKPKSIKNFQFAPKKLFFGHVDMVCFKNTFLLRITLYYQEMPEHVIIKQNGSHLPEIELLELKFL